MTAAPREPSQPRALIGALLLRYAYDAIGYSLLALPVLNATTASGISYFPNAGQLLFQDGGLWLLELIRTQQASLLSSLRPGLWLFALVAFGALLPDWWMLNVLARRQLGVAAPAGLALRRLSLLGIATSLLQGLGWAAAIGLSSPLRARLGALPDERVADLGVLGLFALCLLLELGVSLWRDLTAVSIVGPGQRPWAAAKQGLRRAREPRLVSFYAAVRLASLAAGIGAEALATVLGGANGVHPGLGFGVHQAGMLLRFTLRLVWLSRALQRPRGAQAEAFL